ncbi:MAG: hypothetical protein DRK00_08730 [Thermoprotei archaeon]|nr:MAG: hypothetical protein DRK00_08730 [Thermoprotei archaeon]
MIEIILDTSTILDITHRSTHTIDELLAKLSMMTRSGERIIVEFFRDELGRARASDFVRRVTSKIRVIHLFRVAMKQESYRRRREEYTRKLGRVLDRIKSLLELEKWRYSEELRSDAFLLIAALAKNGCSKRVCILTSDPGALKRLEDALRALRKEYDCASRVEAAWAWG